MLVLPPVCSIDAWEGTATLVSPTRIALHTNNHLQHLLGEASFVLPMKLSMVYGLIWPSSMTRGAEGSTEHLHGAPLQPYSLFRQQYLSTVQQPK